LNGFDSLRSLEIQNCEGFDAKDVRNFAKRIKTLKSICFVGNKLIPCENIFDVDIRILWKETRTQKYNFPETFYNSFDREFSPQTLLPFLLPIDEQ